MNTVNKKTSIKEIKKEIKKQEFGKAFTELNKISDPEDDFLLQQKYASLLKSIPLDGLDLNNIRIAVLASSTIAHFIDVLKYWLAKAGLSAEIYEAEYDTINQTVLNPNSDLYKFKPDITMIFTNHRDVAFREPKEKSFKEIKEIVKETVNEFVFLWEKIQEHTNSFILQNNADLPSTRTMGNFEGTVLWSNAGLLRDFNLELAQAVTPGVTIFDLDYLSSIYGKRKWQDSRFWYHSKHAFALDATGLVAFEASKVISSTRGFSKKCMVLDLDNTLWGGIIGDDGIEGIVLGHGTDGEAFVDFQKYLLALKNRGIILAVCSKNEEDLAKEPFLNHPDMQIKLEDIAVFKANWNNKAENIKEIASDLNIGLDHMVFIDDNPAEREIVRSFLPMVAVPEMPSDPTGYIQELNRQSYFEIIAYSEDDKIRNDYYRDNVSRKNLKKQSTDLSEYYKNLQMEAIFNDFDEFNIARISQLINKSNQFHLTTTRYSEAEILSFMQDEKKHCLYFRLKDRYGDNGLISVVILEEQDDNNLFIDTWVMSCRVFSRTLEEFIANEIIKVGQKIGAKSLIGKYAPTKKNKIVSQLYEKLKFNMINKQEEATFWELKIDDNIPSYKTFIA
ncbi:MAG: HAD-IIIC family phosphatase [Pseudomonadota bacterium]